MSSVMDLLCEKFVNIVEFMLILTIGLLVQYLVNLQLNDIGADALFSMIFSWAVFGFVVLVYYGKIRAIIHGYI